MRKVNPLLGCMAGCALGFLLSHEFRVTLDEPVKIAASTQNRLRVDLEHARNDLEGARREVAQLRLQSQAKQPTPPPIQSQSLCTEIPSQSLSAQVPSQSINTQILSPGTPIPSQSLSPPTPSQSLSPSTPGQSLNPPTQPQSLSSWRSNQKVLECVKRKQHEALINPDPKVLRLGGPTDHPWIEKYFQSHPNPQLIIDVGGNSGAFTGEVTAKFAAQLESSRLKIHTFEPDPTTFSTLKKNVAGKLKVAPEVAALQAKGVVLHNEGVADTPGKLDMYDGGGTSAQHTLRPLGKKLGSVEVRTLSSLEGELGAGFSVDFLKVDTEGFDVKVLKGAEQWFAEGKIKQGSIEWIDRRLQVGDSDPMLTARGLGEFGDRHGYDFYFLSYAKHFLLADGMGPAALEPMATWSNMGFIRRDHPDYDKLVPPATTFAAECL